MNNISVLSRFHSDANSLSDSLSMAHNGIIKGNDSIGFSYKLEEYFQDGALA